MGQETIIMDKIAGLLYEYPENEFTIREISKKIKIPKSTVQKYLSVLKEKGLAGLKRISLQVVTPLKIIL